MIQSIDTQDKGFSMINGFSGFGDEAHKLAKILADDYRDKLAENIEMYASAFLKETNLKASECVLEVTPVGMGYRYEFKKKD